MNPSELTPERARALFRAGLETPTSGFAPGYAQANLIALPREAAFDFLLFAQRNPKPCPILDVTEPGEVSASVFGGDLRTDLPAYRVYRHGELTEERTDVTDLWRDDLVAFLIGCSFTFETPLLEAGVPVRHIEAGTNVAMYRTNRECRPAGRFRGPLVVSMRPIPADRVADAVRVTSRYPAVHGAPVHVGDPAGLGIADLSRPDYGDPVEVGEGEIPVFWACGVTPQAAVTASAPEFAIGHAPGHMAVTDVRDSFYQVP
ncbi:putative hydro-lyase [Nocardiopsis lambiniae]|uniref:Putative hydro-lyase RM479_19755 n=1 Tax=Nocardiopsis lambiniae TaxID=3075539 RepID=A0ABU2MDK9_9ACTN|nr:putative hydro-lyase [Nocardiopsis sp. DSM 44743]MDT0330657.1 putative hydro-lyase [Nocardiopsis sp. DSM 44743]